MELCATYHWPPDFWRHLGWRQLQAYIREHNARAERRAAGQVTGAGTWDGGRDQFWQEQDAKRRQMRGW